MNGSVQVGATSTKDGKVVTTYRAQKVTAGLRGDSHVEIVSGLKLGERVKPGMYKGPSRQAIDLQMK